MSRKLVCVLALTALAAAGCGSGTPPPADKGEALVALRAALDAWQKGAKPEALKDRSPPILAVDAAWTAGTKLAKYEVIETEAAESGFDLGVPVKLWLGDGSRPPQRVKYSIATRPTLVITRDFGG